jgi:hypothetical protein
MLCKSKAPAHPSAGAHLCSYRQMNNYPPSVKAELEREDRLDVARVLYKSLLAQYPNKSIILCDDHARVLAHNDGYGDAAIGLLSEA